MGLAATPECSILWRFKMIVATIGRQQFKLKDIAAAEVLLKILSDS